MFERRALTGLTVGKSGGAASALLAWAERAFLLTEVKTALFTGRSSKLGAMYFLCTETVSGLKLPGARLGGKYDN